MRLRYTGTCGCGQVVPAGAQAGWDAVAKQVVCNEWLKIPDATPAPIDVPVDPGRAGASLQQEYERRRAKRQDRIRAAHPRLGGVILALTEEPASTRAFKIGAAGERKAVEPLRTRSGPAVLLLTNRLLGPGRRDGDIDVLAITPSGVYVADIKYYKDKTVEVRRTGGLFSRVKEELIIGGRDKTSLLDS